MQRVIKIIPLSIYSWLNFILNPFYLLFRRSIATMSSDDLTVISIENLGFSEKELNDIKDNLSLQAPLEGTSIHTQDTSSVPPIIKALSQLKSLCSQLPDPLDERIIKVMDSICALTQDTRNDFILKYKNLINVTGDDFNEILDDLIISTTQGPHTLLCMMKISIKAYSLGIAKTAHTSVSDIVTLATDLTVIVQDTFEQHKVYEESLKNISQAWNSVSTSMTNYMTQIDTRNLNLSYPNKAQRSTLTCPSLDSRSSPDPMSHSLIKLSMGQKYKCHLGSLNYMDHGNLGFVSDTSEGILIAKFVGKIKSTKVIERVLNKDLDHVCQKLRENSKILDDYENLNKEERFAFFSKLVESILDKVGQWVTTNTI